MQQPGVLFIIKKDAEVLIGGAGKPGARAAPGGAQAVEEGWLRQLARFFGHMPQGVLAGRAVSDGRSPVGVPELGKGVVRAGRKCL